MLTDTQYSFTSQGHDVTDERPAFGNIITDKYTGKRSWSVFYVPGCDWNLQCRDSSLETEIKDALPIYVELLPTEGSKRYIPLMAFTTNLRPILSKLQPYQRNQLRNVSTSVIFSVLPLPYGQFWIKRGCPQWRSFSEMHSTRKLKQLPWRCRTPAVGARAGACCPLRRARPHPDDFSII